MKKIIFLTLFIFLLAIQVFQVKADDILINSVNSIPKEASLGERVDVTINLENIGAKNIKNIAVKLDLSQAPFAPVDSSTEYIIQELDSDESTSVPFSLIVLPTATPGIYKIPIEVAYSNVTKKALISLTVQVKPQLFVELDKTDIIYAGTSGNVIIKFVNNGLADIKFLTVILDNSQSYDILSSKTVYIGNIDRDDTQTAEFKIFQKDRSSVLPLKIEYRDANNNLYRDNKLVSFNTYTKDQAEKLGLIKKSNFMNYIIFILIIIVLFLIFKFRRKRKNEW